MAQFKTIVVSAEAIKYTNHFSPEIEEFLKDTPHFWDPSKGIIIATLTGPVLVKSYTWMVKCPRLWKYIKIFTNEEFTKMFEPVA